jgi:hypothetical protein
MATPLNQPKDNPWRLKTPPGTSEYTMHTGEKNGKKILVCTFERNSPEAGCPSIRTSNADRLLFWVGDFRLGSISPTLTFDQSGAVSRALNRGASQRDNLLGSMAESTPSLSTT